MDTCRAADWKFKHCAHPTKRKEENKKNRMALKPEEFFFHRGSFIKESRIMRLILRPPAGLLNQACEAAVTARGLPPVCFFLSLCYSFSWRNQRELAILLIHSAFFSCVVAHRVLFLCLRALQGARVEQTRNREMYINIETNTLLYTIQ